MKPKIAIVGTGLGGSTKAWHNALMEIDAPVFDKKWPGAWSI